MVRTKCISQKETTTNKFINKKARVKYDDIVSKRTMFVDEEFIFTTRENSRVLVYVH